MKRILIIFFLFATAINAAPPRRHEMKLQCPDSMPLQAPMTVTIEIPEVLVPAVEEALTYSVFGTTGERLVRTAKKFLGCRYGVGQRGPKRFDCSGLTSVVYEMEGIQLSRDSRSQFTEGICVSAEELQPGDLVFFSRNNTPAGIYHVGMVVEANGRGDFRFIHSARTGVRVDSSTDEYYARNYYGARRILADPNDFVTLDEGD